MKQLNGNNSGIFNPLTFLAVNCIWYLLFLPYSNLSAGEHRFKKIMQWRSVAANLLVFAFLKKI